MIGICRDVKTSFLQMLKVHHLLDEAFLLEFVYFVPLQREFICHPSHKRFKAGVREVTPQLYNSCRQECAQRLVSVCVHLGIIGHMQALNCWGRDN